MANLVVDCKDVLQEERQHGSTVIMDNLLHLYIDRPPFGGVSFYSPLQKQIIELGVFPVGVIPGSFSPVHSREHHILRGTT